MSFGSAQEISLRSFQYEELEQATNGFKEEVGRGAFGTVFKGETECAVEYVVNKYSKWIKLTTVEDIMLLYISA
ncbi:hypothetical protein Syun_031521 [Stephania yunnanensis]|uniref:Protein kinase domain-containing protein n=1 Tax=Stephania yunnanensis TaxID=152371 RepID=A0AAP0DW30_9MAGN